MTGLRLDDVRIRLNGVELLHLSETIEPGDILAVMGPSGSGKSSLLAYVGGFLDANFEASGDVSLGGQKLTGLPAHERHTGILFQDPLLYPHMSVGENLLFAIPAKVTGNQRKETALNALAQAGLEGFFDRDPATLSGGQKARVALMRVLVSQPRALLLDEPFSKLDASRRDHIRQFVFDEAKSQNLPTLLVTHDEADAKAAGGKIIDLDG
ncbi:MAG: ATP-binding cassette domain-containing protein [Rhizobiaceae bacterium]|nr:ATP-binding cassette domain-containing protein [Hyphomicrobiales bacterium]NRB30938.1 ATP-binding cassette domain-containing protein [Rhizobiaceae bacterium]